MATLSRKRSFEVANSAFVKWMDDVQKIINDKVGLELTDFSDEDFQEFFHSNCTAQEMANQMIDEYLSTVGLTTADLE